jgi:hypothetical protein
MHHGGEGADDLIRGELEKMAMAAVMLTTQCDVPMTNTTPPPMTTNRLHLRKKSGPKSVIPQQIGPQIINQNP